MPRLKAVTFGLCILYLAIFRLVKLFLAVAQKPPQQPLEGLAVSPSLCQACLCLALSV